MVNGVEKPVPKPRKLPPALGFVIPTDNNENRDGGKIKEVKSVSDESLNQSNSIGWSSQLTEEYISSDNINNQEERGQNHLSLDYIDNHMNGYDNEHSHSPPISSPPPPILSSIKFPDGPPPPIPPRNYKGKPVPFITKENELPSMTLENSLSNMKLTEISTSINSVEEIESLPTPTSSVSITNDNTAELISLQSTDSDHPSIINQQSLHDNNYYNNSLDYQTRNRLAIVDHHPVAHSICLSGWVTYKAKSDMHLWLVLRNNELTFYRDELVRLINYKD